MLIHDDAALAKFHRDRNIPNDILIKRPGPNEDASLVEGEG